MTERAALERRIVTILFADLVGFTRLSEELDPEDVATVQDAYFAAARDTIARHGGIVEKYAGDAVMAVFGAELARDDDAERAVRAGLSLVAAVEALGARLGLEGALGLRVGVNSGEVVGTGAATADRALVTGDPVNVAARLQSAAAPGTVLLGEVTALAVAGSVELAEVEPLALKGKSEPVRASLALALRPEPSRDHALAGLRAPLVGRDRELRLLEQALERVGDGNCERWVVIAPPGVGKSRLLQEFAGGVRGARVWTTRVRSFHSSPYEPVADLVRAALGAWGLEDTVAPEAFEPARALLRTRLAALGLSEAAARAAAAEALALLWPAQAPRTAERESAFAAWTAALDALAEGPGVWAVEDVHWATTDLLDFLAFAAEPAAPARRLLVTTARPSLLERAPAWCGNGEPSNGPRLLHLRPLSAADTAGLVRFLVGAALPERLVDRIVGAAGGTPLFVEELFRAWISADALVGAGGSWKLAASPDVPLPATVQALYAAQLDDLPRAARGVARRASVAGRRFAAAALDALEARDAAEGLELLSRRALLEGPSDDPALGETYAYRHALLRDAAYASLARSERARLHARLAAWLERETTGDEGHATTIAGHYAAALASAPALASQLDDEVGREEARARAARWFERAGEEALRTAAQDTARELFRQALEHTPPEPSGDRARRLVRLGAATAAAADLAEGIAAVDEALALARDLAAEGDPEAQAIVAPAAATLARLWFEQLRFADGGALADEILAETGGGGDEGQARLLLARAFAATALTNDVRRGLDDVGLALAIARDRDDAALELDARGWFLQARVSDHRLLATVDFPRTKELAERLGRWTTLVEALENEALQRLDDDAERALPLLDRAAEVASVRRLTEDLAWIDYIRCEALIAHGRWGEARAAGLRAVELGRAHAYHRVTFRSWCPLVPTAVRRGDRELVEGAWEWWRTARDRLPRTPFGLGLITAMDLAFADAGYQPRELPELEPLLPSFRVSYGSPSWLGAVDAIVEGWLERGQLHSARRAIAELEAVTAAPEMSERSRAHAALLRARLCTAEDAPPAEVRAHAERALAGFRASGSPWGVARAEALLEEARG